MFDAGCIIATNGTDKDDDGYTPVHPAACAGLISDFVCHLYRTSQCKLSIEL